MDVHLHWLNLTVHTLSFIFCGYFRLVCSFGNLENRGRANENMNKNWKGKKVINIEHLVHKKTQDLSCSHPIPMAYMCRTQIPHRTELFLRAGYVLCHTRTFLEYPCFVLHRLQLIGYLERKKGCKMLCVGYLHKIEQCL